MSFLSAREKAGLSQRDAAARLGVVQTSVHFWETGRYFPRGPMLIKLAELYDCSIDELLGREPRGQNSA